MGETRLNLDKEGECVYLKWKPNHMQEKMGQKLCGYFFFSFLHLWRETVLQLKNHSFPEAHCNKVVYDLI